MFNEHSISFNCFCFLRGIGFLNWIASIVFSTGIAIGIFAGASQGKQNSFFSNYYNDNHNFEFINAIINY